MSSTQLKAVHTCYTPPLLCLPGQQTGPIVHYELRHMGWQPHWVTTPNHPQADLSCRCSCAAFAAADTAAGPQVALQQLGGLATAVAAARCQ